MALGSQTGNVVYDLGLTLNKWGNIIINSEYKTSNSKIFAGGDTLATLSTLNNNDC